MLPCLHHSSTVPIHHRGFLGREMRVAKRQKGLAVADALSYTDSKFLPCHEAEKRELSASDCHAFQGLFISIKGVY